VDGYAEELERIDSYAEMLANYSIRLDDDALTAHKMLDNVKFQLSSAITVRCAAEREGQPLLQHVLLCCAERGASVRCSSC
jgi:hypothetical protein